MKGIAFGQYYPAKSALHALDPRVKIILTILYIVCSFLCKNVLSYAALLLSTLLLIIVGRIPLKIILRGLRPVLIVLAFTTVLNIFWTSGEMLIFEWSFIKIYAEGLYAAAFIMVRIVALIIGTSMFLIIPDKLLSIFADNQQSYFLFFSICLAKEDKFIR